MFKKLLKIAASILLAVLLSQFSFYSIESFFLDLRFRTVPSSPVSGKIELVTISANDLLELKREPNLIDLGLAIRAIGKDQPLAIVSMLPLPEKEPQTQLSFLKEAIQGTNTFFAYPEFINPGEEGKAKLPPPLENAQVLPAPISTDKNNFAGDDVSRRVIIYDEGRYFLPAVLSQMVRAVSAPTDYRGAFDFRGSIQTRIDYRRAGAYSTTGFLNALEERFSKGRFKDKIVLIGLDTKTSVNDYVRTPYNRDVIAMTKVESFANAIDTLTQNKGVVLPHESINLLITIAVALLTLYFVFNLPPVRGLLALLAMALVYSLIAWALFALFRVSITMTHPLLAIFVSYYFFIPYRLIQESRKSWEYQQKNKLLTEVEQLKTNFLSMMSHDLKTPLARIQGMADIAIAHPDNLTPEQKTALKTIGQSTDELSTFISSILDLGRVESQEVKLQLQSRDINSLLEEVIAKYEYFAKSKNIEVVKEFEPLFSTKIDVALMKQVFSNLIENAIKYSQEGSKILVSTEEVDGKIQVQVADQGIGIEPGELNNVFMKFYRSQNVKNSPIKGSGLGLFLAKYFVDLHKGQISVESVPEQGSTFTVDLPMQ